MSAFLVSSYFVLPLPFPASFSCFLCLPISSCLHRSSLKPHEANKTTLSVLRSQNQAVWALASHCLDVIYSAQKPCSLFCLALPWTGEACNEVSLFYLYSNVCNSCRGADVYLQESTERLMWGLNNTGTEGSCCPHPLPLFSWEIVGLDTFETVGFVIELRS